MNGILREEIRVRISSLTPLLERSVYFVTEIAKAASPINAVQNPM